MKPGPETDAVFVTAAAAGVLGLVVGVLTGFIERRHGSMGAWLGGIAAAIVVAVLVAWGLKPTGLDPMWQSVLIGCCAYLAEDMLAGLRVLGSMIRNDPLSGLSRILDALRGRAPSSKSENEK